MSTTAPTHMHQMKTLFPLYPFVNCTVFTVHLQLLLVSSLCSIPFDHLSFSLQVYCLFEPPPQSVFWLDHLSHNPPLPSRILGPLHRASFGNASTSQNLISCICNHPSDYFLWCTHLHVSHLVNIAITVTFALHCVCNTSSSTIPSTGGTAYKAQGVITLLLLEGVVSLY